MYRFVDAFYYPFYEKLSFWNLIVLKLWAGMLGYICRPGSNCIVSITL